MRFVGPLTRRGKAAGSFALALLVLSAAMVVRCPQPLAAQVTPRQEPPASFGAQGQPVYSIDGQVLEGGRRAPLENVRVTLTGTKGASLSYVYSDSEGNFVFYRLPLGRYELTFSLAGYQELTISIELEAGPQRGLQVELLPRPAGGASTEAATPVWALKIPSAAQKKYAAAMAALRKGDLQESIRELETAIKLYPVYAGAYAALGYAHLSENNSSAATDAFRKALAIDEALAEANLGLGSLLSSRGELDEAEKMLVRALQAKPGDWKVQFELGQLYVRTENFAAAEEHLRRSLNARHDHARTHLLLINALASQDKLADALAVMDAYLKKFPSDSFAAQVRSKRDALRAHLARP